VAKKEKKQEPMQKQKPKVEGLVGPGGVIMKKLPASWDFTRSIQIWQGAPKSGKTSTAAALGPVAREYGIPGINPFFLLFEAGSGGVEVDCTMKPCACGGKDPDCTDCDGEGVARLVLTEDNNPANPFETIDEWFDWAAQSPHNPIVVDTADAMFSAVNDGICLQMGINDPSQSDHGTAWSAIAAKWRELCGVLTGVNKSVIFLAHIYYQEKRLRGGASITTATFNVSGKSKQFLEGAANQIVHFEVEPSEDDDKHILTTRRCAGIEAGDQWKVYPEMLDLGNSPEAGAKAILGCFYELEEEKENKKQ